MRIIIYLFFILFLSSCNSEYIDSSELTPSILAPIDISDIDYDAFTLGDKVLKLPADYRDFENAGLTINENEFYIDEIDKNQQHMANLKSDTFDIGVTFKNPEDHTIPTIDGKIIELYINQAHGLNNDFSIADLSFGDSYDKAITSLKSIAINESDMGGAKTINYYTDKNYVYLYFNDDKLSGASIFSKAYMRDENYVDGEFLIFGSPVKFPLTIGELENSLNVDFDNLKNDYTLKAGQEAKVKIYSPFYNSDEIYDSDGILLDVINNSDEDISFRDADIKRIICENSVDASVGYLYVGAMVSELKIADKKNQNPPRLKILGKTADDKVEALFSAENNTSYKFTTDEYAIVKIEIINEEK